LDRLGDDVRRQLERFGPQAAMTRIVEAWAAAVGEENARNAWPARLARDGTLHVHTSDSVWAFELTQLEPSIRERLGALAPPRMRFAAGPLPESQTAPSRESGPEAPEPSQADRVAAADLTAEIEDEKLRKLVLDAAAASLARARFDRSV
jgi:Dna[CI] antecedent, DciA